MRFMVLFVAIVVAMNGFGVVLRDLWGVVVGNDINMVKIELV